MKTIKEENTDSRRGTTKIKLRSSVSDGRIFNCISCHRTLFKNQVQILSENFEYELEESHPGLFMRAVGCFNSKTTYGKKYICPACNCYVKKGRVPPMSNQNKRQMFDISNHPEFKLTEL